MAGCHYSSTPILTEGGVNPAIWDPTKQNLYLRKICERQSESDNATIARWVEQSSRRSHYSSSSVLSSSCSSSARTEYDQGWFPVSTPNLTNPNNISDTILSPQEVALIRSTYSSYKTTCYISSSLVNLYTSTPTSPWTLRYTGVPTLVLNCGGSRAREQRGVQILLAERGTGFTLWKDKLDNLSCYTADMEDKMFHSLHYSRDHMVRVGLSWEQGRDAAVFLDWVEDLTSSPENLGLSGPKTKLKLQGKRKDKVDKVEISRPCGFRHNVSISMEDRDTFYSMMVNINAVTDVNKL